MRAGTALLVCSWACSTAAFQPSAELRQLSRHPALSTKPFALSPRRHTITAVADNGNDLCLPARLDKSEVGKYAAATVMQFGLMSAFYAGVDRVAGILSPSTVGALFFALSLRSRLFSFMDSSTIKTRAERAGAAALRPSGVKRPSWTPPGRYLAIVWLVTAGLRGAASAMAYSAAAPADRRLLCAPLLGLAAHLAIGDTWNTVTNVEQRLGVSCVFSVAVAASAFGVAWGFVRLASPASGLVLLPSALWLTAACALTAEIWRLNTPLQPLLPRCSDGDRAARWGAQYSILALVTVPVSGLLKAVYKGKSGEAK